MNTETKHNPQLTYDELMALFLENSEQIKASRELFENKMQGYERKLEEEKQLLKLKIQENERKSKRDDKRFKKLETLFTGQWGKLIESLVEGKLVQILQERGIDVERTLTNLRDEKREMEFDILAINGTEVVVVEVKTTLKNDDVVYFIEKLKRFRRSYREYYDKQLLGAVAFLKSETNVVKYAEDSGLFTIKATGDSAKIVNKNSFVPKTW
jgi:hypothetical protein